MPRSKKATSYATTDTTEGKVEHGILQPRPRANSKRIVGSTATQQPTPENGQAKRSMVRRPARHDDTARFDHDGDDLRGIDASPGGICPFCGQQRPGRSNRSPDENDGENREAGGTFGRIRPNSTIQGEVDNYLALRKAALDSPDFDLSDKLRWILKSQYGVSITDTMEGQYWKFENGDMIPSRWTWFQHNRVLRELHG